MKDMLAMQAGPLVPIGYAEKVDASTDSRYTFKDAPGKRWAFVREPVRHRVLRQWKVEVPNANAEDHSTMLEIVNGAWGAGPFKFMPQTAFSMNMLTSKQSLLDYRGVGPMSVTTAGGGHSAIYLDLSGGDTWRATVPTPYDGGGWDLRFSFEALGDGDVTTLATQVSQVWQKTNGTSFSSSTMTRHEFTLDMTFPVKEGNPYYEYGVEVRGFSKFLRPMITVGSVDRWSVGQSAQKVVVDASSWIHHAMLGCDSGPLTSVDLTLREVG